MCEHLQNNRSVRDMLGQRGIQPENLPPAEDIKKLERRVKSQNVKSDSDLIATNRSVAKAVLAIHVIIAELANKKLRPTKGTE